MIKIFEKVTCDRCQKRFDNKLDECPKCHNKNPNFDISRTNTCLFWLDPLRQLCLFLLVWIGLSVLSFLTQLIGLAIMINANPNIDPKILASSNELIFSTNAISYALCIIIILIIIFPYIKKLLPHFNKLKPYFYGIGIMGLLVALSVVWGMISTSLYSLITGEASTGENINQQTLVSLIKIYPVLSLIIFGFVGPIVEEFGYRVGLFNFLQRKNKIFAYVISGIIFGLIHFTIPSSTNGWINELLQLPNYIFAGLLLCFAYDRYGLSAAITGHVLNNVLSVVLIMVGQ